MGKHSLSFLPFCINEVKHWTSGGQEWFSEEQLFRPVGIDDHLSSGARRLWASSWIGGSQRSGPLGLKQEARSGSKGGKE